MINLQDFINSTVNQQIDVDNAYGHQCYDLPAKWIIDNNWGNGFYCAWSGGVRDLIEHYDEISGIDKSKLEVHYNNPNDSSQIPQAGDIVVYNWGDYGHIGIVINANNNSMDTLEQNIGNGSGDGYDDRTQLVYGRLYDGVIGWVREKKQTTEEKKIENNMSQEFINQMSNIFYFNQDRINVIIHAYNIDNKDYLMFELIEAGKNIDINSNQVTNLIEKGKLLEKQLLPINASPNLDSKVKDELIIQEVKQEPKTTVIKPVLKSKTIFESKKAIMSILATFITFIVTLLNQKYQMNLQVQEILAIVSPLIIGVVSQASTEIIK